MGYSGSQQKNRPCDGHGSVDLAGVDDADQLVAHGHQMHVSGRKGVAEGLERLIRQRTDIGQPRRLDLSLAHAATDEHEYQPRLVLKSSGGLEDGRERIAGPVIAAVHDDELPIQPVRHAERVHGVRHRLEVVIQRPRGNDGELVAHVALRVDSLGHETVQDDHVGGARQNPPIQPVQEAHRQCGGMKAAERDHLIGVEVHHPELERRAA